MADDQAYQGAMDLHSGGSEFNTTDFIVRQILRQTCTATLVLVKAVDTVARTVDVQPMVHQLDGYGNVVPHGLVHGAPYVTLQGGSCAILIDPQVGDIGLAVFGSSDLSSVKANKAPSPPGSLRRNDWSDAIYLGGLLNPAPTQFVRFLQSGGVDLVATGQVTISTSGTVHLAAGLVNTSDTFAAGNGATGTFTSQDGKVVTVSSGIVTRIV